MLVLAGPLVLHLSLTVPAAAAQVLDLGPFFAVTGQALTLFAPTGEQRLAQRGACRRSPLLTPPPLACRGRVGRGLPGAEAHAQAVVC